MDWTNIAIPAGSIIASIFTLKKLVFDDIRSELKEIRKDIQGLDRRIQRIEDRLEYSNKVVYVQHEELKKN